MFSAFKLIIALLGIVFLIGSTSNAQTRGVVHVVNSKNAVLTLTIPSAGQSLRNIPSRIPLEFRSDKFDQGDEGKILPPNNKDSAKSVIDPSRLDEPLDEVRNAIRLAMMNSSGPQKTELMRLVKTLADLVKKANVGGIDVAGIESDLKELLSKLDMIAAKATNDTDKEQINKVTEKVQELLPKENTSQPELVATAPKKNSINLISIEKRLGKSRLRIYFPFSLLDSVIGSYKVKNGDLIRISAIDETVWSYGYVTKMKIDGLVHVEEELRERGYVQSGRLKTTGNSSLIDQDDSQIKFDKTEIADKLTASGDVFLRIARRVDYTYGNANVIHMIYIPYYRIPRIGHQKLSDEKEWFNQQPILGGDVISGMMWSDDKILRALYIKNELIKKGKFDKQLTKQVNATASDLSKNASPSVLSNVTRGKLPKMELPDRIKLTSPLDGIRNLKIKGPNLELPF